MSYIILIYSIVCFIIFLSITKISYQLNLVDIPSKRKMHSHATAYTGGIPVSFSILISLLIFDIPSSSLNNILSVAFLISIIGFVVLVLASGRAKLSVPVSERSSDC